MKKLPLLALPFLLAASVFADDTVRDVQSELKTRGFYYGDVDGQTGEETAAAVRRFQIRNGLEVTGTLTGQTLESLGIRSGKPAPLAPKPSAPAPPAARPPASPPVNLLRESSVEESDRAFLRREELRQRPPVDEPARDPYIISPPAPMDAPSNDFPVLFARTPYSNAPREVQQQVLARAQAILARRGLYRDIVDGLPGPATQQAIVGYQRSARLILTGRLDLETLGSLRLLPTRGGVQPGTTSTRERSQPVYRGIWVN